MSLIENDINFSEECGYLKHVNNRLCLEMKKILMEQYGEYLDYFRNEEESIFEKKFKKQMETCFATMFEEVRHERSLISLLSITDPDILKQSKITCHDINIIKNLALEILHRQKCLNASHLLD